MVIIYYQSKSIGSCQDCYSLSFTAFDVEIFAIVKALQMLKAYFTLDSNRNTTGFNKAVLFTDSSSLLKLLSTNLFKFLHYPSYV